MVFSRIYCSCHIKHSDDFDGNMFLAGLNDSARKEIRYFLTFCTYSGCMFLMAYMVMRKTFLLNLADSCKQRFLAIFQPHLPFRLQGNNTVLISWCDTAVCKVSLIRKLFFGGKKKYMSHAVLRYKRIIRRHFSTSQEVDNAFVK